MNTKGFSTLGRLMMVVVALTLLLSLTGGKPASAAVIQSSYIVQATSTDLAVSLVEKYGGTVTSRLDIIRAVAANLSQQGVAQIRLEKGIQGVTLNGTVKTSNANYNTNNGKKKTVPSTDYPNVVGADLAWQKDVTGEGVTVAVLDTGMGDLTALTKDINNKAGRIVAWKDFIDHSRNPIDPNGHGSHVAGIIGNSQKGDDGEWNGVAPGIDLVGVRVLDENGAGTYETVISGLQWVIEHRKQYDISIVNLSIVAPVQSPYWADPLDQAVTVAWAKGLTVIVAAGNSGPEPSSITVPGNNPYVITVGAFTDNYTPSDWNDDYIAAFSGAGPTLDGFVKPDLVAPGGHMVSVVPDDSILAQQYPANQLNAHYFTLAGTSQATAVVSGIAALVLAKHPNMTPDEVKARLMSTSLPWVDASTTNALYSMWQQGAGRANAPDAVFAKTKDSANAGMDIKADIAGTIHYEGYSYYDETTSTYRLYDPYGDWAGGYGTWDGSHGAWSGSHGAWSGDFGAWTGSHGAWSGSHGAWSGSHGAWSGSHGAWSGSHGAWSGGYTTWTGSHGAWSGSHGAWSGTFADPTFIARFISGESPDSALSTATISFFVDEP